MPINAGTPQYLDSIDFNIPLKANWNNSLLAGLEVITQEINDAHLKEDIVDIDVERVDEFAGFSAQGSIGYATSAKHGEITGSYYIDFVYHKIGDKQEYWYTNTKYFQELNEALSVYLSNVKDYKLTKCNYDIEVMDDLGMVLILRAYFVKSAK